MNLESMYELCCDVCDFYDMMVNDSNMLHKQNECLWGDEKALAKANLLDNLIEDFKSIYESAKKHLGDEELL